MSASTLLDQQIVPVVSDGSDGGDAYTVILTNENHTFVGNETSALSGNADCNVIAYKGATQVAANIGTITVCKYLQQQHHFGIFQSQRDHQHDD